MYITNLYINSYLIHYIPNQKATQIDLILTNEEEILKKNNGILSYKKGIDMFSVSQWGQKLL